MTPNPDPAFSAASNMAAWEALPPHTGVAQERTCPWARHLPSGQAVTLPAAEEPRWLRVLAGRVWLTKVQQHGEPEDIWLSAGSARLLSAGSRWIVEAWPEAWLSVVVDLSAALSATSDAGRQPARRWWPLDRRADRPLRAA